MQALLISTLVALAAAYPGADSGTMAASRQIVTEAPKAEDLARQIVTDGPKLPAYPDLPIPEDDHFEYRNPDITDDGEPLFESDMLLTREQRDSRQAAANIWNSPVLFSISSTSEPDRAKILQAIQHWTDKSCITFSEVSDTVASTTPRRLRFIKSSGCWSYLGKGGSTGPQSVSIGGGCAWLSVIAHEIGHAMGLFHQQSRTDRDSYVQILWDNIRSGYAGQFNIKSSAVNHSVPYDLTSNMHYGATYFTKNGQKTIQVRDLLHESLRRSNGLSHRDRHIVNVMYQCDAACSSAPTCQNGGFVDASCTCVCPPNTSGSNCETKNGEYYPAPVCGNTAMNAPGTITTPNYPANFPKNVVCFWIITAPEGQRVQVNFTYMKMLYRSGGKCYWDYASIRYTGNDYTDDELACNKELEGRTFTSTGNKFIVKFKSGNYGWYKGFSADVTFV